MRVLQLGGLGFLHNNMTPGEQLAQALRVKRHTPGFVVSPAVLSPQATVAEYDDLRVCGAAMHAPRWSANLLSCISSLDSLRKLVAIL